MFSNFSQPKKQVNWRAIALFIVVDYVLVVLINFVFASGWLTPIADATAGLINRTLIGNLPGLLGVVMFGLIRLGKLKAADLGLVWSKLRSGVLFTAGLWLLIQIIQAVLGFVVNGKVILNADWSQLGITAITGILLGQIFGNVLYEDITYRGFLLPQVSLNLGKRWLPVQSQQLIAGLAISQLLFAIRHIPGRILMGSTFVDAVLSLFPLLLIGLLYALLYIRTGNLFLVMGVHVLTNAPTPLFSVALISPYLLVLGLSFVTLLIWPVITRKQDKRAPQAVSLHS